MIFLLYNNYPKWYFHMYTLYNICLTNIKWVSCILVYQTNILCILSFNLMLGLHSLYLLVTCSCVWIYFLYLFSSILNKLSLWILLRPPPLFIVPRVMETSSCIEDTWKEFVNNNKQAVQTVYASSNGEGCQHKH